MTPPIDSIPNECLVLILQQLDEPMTVASVSKRFLYASLEACRQNVSQDFIDLNFKRLHQLLALRNRISLLEIKFSPIFDDPSVSTADQLRGILSMQYFLSKTEELRTRVESLRSRTLNNLMKIQV